jgi:hypothetical protein
MDRAHGLMRARLQTPQSHRRIGRERVCREPNVSTCSETWELGRLHTAIFIRLDAEPKSQRF